MTVDMFDMRGSDDRNIETNIKYGHAQALSDCKCERNCYTWCQGDAGMPDSHKQCHAPFELVAQAVLAVFHVDTA
ncbi:hypothetical protein MAR_000195 [Mya arenaria]|uniref:Uncharacterized protein n=1 Tax=Mya arenaria TaxID=6604 RepID=A0ABY7FBF4_MYAAR|nr:hypothetical protein MAR_000195 [Mya arenaria]